MHTKPGIGFIFFATRWACPGQWLAAILAESGIYRILVRAVGAGQGREAIFHMLIPVHLFVF